MTEYRYRAIDSSGTEKEGTIRSGSLNGAKDAVIAMGLDPLEVYEKQAQILPEVAPFPLYSDLQKVHATEKISTQSEPRQYFPLLETLRLYAGWLLAWYCLVYALGSYQFMRNLPFHVPYAESLFLSPLVLSFTFAAYLFLMLSGFYVTGGRKKLQGIILLIAGIAVFLVYRMNVS